MLAPRSPEHLAVLARPCRIRSRRFDLVMKITVFGYDPGGNGNHGVATLQVEVRRGRVRPVGKLSLVDFACLSDVTHALDHFASNGKVALGVDTLTRWNSGRSGFRPADDWIREHDPRRMSSVVSPNGMRGSMAVNGAALIRHADTTYPSQIELLTEAHPKVLAGALHPARTDWYRSGRRAKRNSLCAWFEVPDGEIDDQSLSGDHAYDAALAALAAYAGLSGKWTKDLHQLNDEDAECGSSISIAGIEDHFYWPEDLSNT